MSDPGGAGRRGVRGAAWMDALLIVAVALGVCLPGLGSLPLADPEESRCAMTVGEMLRTHRLLVPRLGRPYFGKPPLFFWLAAAGTALTGDVELGGRLVSALAGVGVCLCAWHLGRRMFSPLTGLLAGLVLATCVEQFALARWYRMEMLHALLVTLSLVCFWRVEGGGQTGAGRRRAWYGFYLFAALAALAKGPLGLIIPLAVVVAYRVVGRQWRRLAEAFRPGPLLVFAAVALPWFVYMTWAYWPDYPREFFLRTHLQRALTSVARDWMPPGFYLLVVAGGFAPWTLVLPGMAVRSFARGGRAPGQDKPPRGPEVPSAPKRLLWTWAILVVVFFELSQTKFLHYILAAFAPLAVLAGEYLAAAIARGGEAMRRGGLRWSAIAAIGGAAAFAAGITIFEVGTGGSIDRWTPLLWLAGAGTAAGIARSIVTRRPAGFVAATVAGMVFHGVFVSLHTMPAVYSALSLREEGLSAAGTIPATDRAFMLAEERYSFFVYAGRPDATAYSEKHVGDLVAELGKAPATVFHRAKSKVPMLRTRAPAVRFDPPVPLGRGYYIVHSAPVEPGQTTGAAGSTSASRFEKSTSMSRSPG